MNAIQSAAQEQLNKLKAECVRRLEEQKKELQAKQNEMGDLGFSAMPMMDPFAGLGTGSTPPVTPSAGRGDGGERAGGLRRPGGAEDGGGAGGGRAGGGCAGGGYECDGRVACCGSDGRG